MGFREKQTIYRLEFDGDFEGLVVKVTVPSMGKVLELERSVGEMAGLVGKDVEDLSSDDITLAVTSDQDIVATFLANLVDWNVEDAAGRAIPATADGLSEVSSTLGKHVIKTWWEFVNDVPAPKERSSSSGKPPLEASLPMEPLSPSRAS